MTDLVIVDAEPIHVGMISRRLRAEDRAEIEALYPDVRRAIRGCFRASVVRRAAFVDGEIAALWGLAGTLLSVRAYAWLATTEAIRRIPPWTVLREARAQLSEMMCNRAMLRSHVAEEYCQGIRFLRLAGFSVREPEPIGRNGELFREVVMGDGDW